MFLDNKFFLLTSMYLIVYILVVILHISTDFLYHIPDLIIAYYVLYGYIHACVGYYTVCYMHTAYDVSSKSAISSTGCHTLFQSAWTGFCGLCCCRSSSVGSIGQSSYVEVVPELDLDSESGMV